MRFIYYIGLCIHALVHLLNYLLSTYTVGLYNKKAVHRKDDRAMRPIHGALKIFGTP